MGKESRITRRPGRPKNLTPNKKKTIKPQHKVEVFKAFEKFVNTQSNPQIANFVGHNEVAIKYWIDKEDIETWPELKPLLKRAYAKQESFYVSEGVTGTPGAATFSQFILKQPHLKYKDKVEQDITSAGEKITFMNAVPRPGKSLKKQKTEK